MFRARIDAVNGSKVFAGGKWLTCIGNKPVRVGEYVWTDGRCVYGNNQVHQQPLVITVPEDEGIPINCFDVVFIYNGVASSINKGQFSFAKNKIKKIGDLSPYCSLSINDFNRYFYFYFANDIIAANIDKAGNTFYILAKKYDDVDNTCFELYKNGMCFKTVPVTEAYNEFTSFFPANPLINDADNPDIETFGNGKESTYSLKIEAAFIENENSWYIRLQLNGKEWFRHYKKYIYNDVQMFVFTPTESDHLLFWRQGIVDSFFGSQSLLSAITSKDISQYVSLTYVEVFPEKYSGVSYRNQVIIEGSIRSGLILYGRKELATYAATILGLYAQPAETEGKYETFSARYEFCLNNAGLNLLEKQIDGMYYSDEYLDPDAPPMTIHPYKPFYLVEDYSGVNNTKFPLDYGCYYKIEDIVHPDYVSASSGNLRVVSFFLDDNQKIFSIYCGTTSKFLVAKIKTSFLFYIGSSFTLYDTENNSQISSLNSYGLYLYKDAKLQLLLECKVTNERLRPMKKIKNWQKHINEIILD